VYGIILSCAHRIQDGGLHRANASHSYSACTRMVVIWKALTPPRRHLVNQPCDSVMLEAKAWRDSLAIVDIRNASNTNINMKI
jgi:hypothetical protein